MRLGGPGGESGLISKRGQRAGLGAVSTADFVFL